MNDEIAALVRAGVPLEQGLGALGDDLPGRLGQFAHVVAEQCARGRSLDDIMADQTLHLPLVYRAVVRAGVRSGRLPVALQSLAHGLRRVDEIRKGMFSALLYPTLVMLTAWGFFIFFVTEQVPDFLAGYDRMGGAGRTLLETLARLAPTAIYWGPVVPIVALVLLAVWWRRSSRANITDSGTQSWLFGWLPWPSHTLRLSRVAAMVEILTVLVEHRVPLDEALSLAAEASGDRNLVAASDLIVQKIRRGESLALDTNNAAVLRTHGFPPLLTWLLGSRTQRDNLLRALRRVAESYRRRADHQAGLARLLVPIVLTLVLGASFTFAYTLLLFGSYAALLRTIAGP